MVLLEIIAHDTQHRSAPHTSKGNIEFMRLLVDGDRVRIDAKTITPKPLKGSTILLKDSDSAGGGHIE
jgi:hypothetical protein